MITNLQLVGAYANFRDPPPQGGGGGHSIWAFKLFKD